MEMHHIRYFLAVAEELNFTRAAEKCHVAQPSLTRAIQQLEAELGGPLFHRERANTHLSELGRMVQPYLAQAFEQTRSAKDQALSFVKFKRTVLKLGVMCTVGPAHLIELIGGLQERYEGLELEILDASAWELQDRLLKGDLEVALYCLPGHEPDARLHYMPLFREQYMIAVSPKHRLAKQNAIRVCDLDGEKYLSRINCEYNAYPGPGFRAYGANCSTVYRSERDDWILAMAASGLGFAFVPRHCADHPGVVAHPLIDPEFWREVALVTVRGRPHSPGVGALVREAMRASWLGEQAISRQRAEFDLELFGDDRAAVAAPGAT